VEAEPEVPKAIVASKYRLTRLLGRGGMGSVWEGVHTTLGTRVAVKFIDAEHANSAEARTRFENEARAAATLKSKHVVEVYDHGMMEDGRPFIVMEFLEGEPLDQRLDRVGRLTPKDTARLLQQVCRALSKAHAAGIVHRDLKPENIFLVWDDEDAADIVKVVDFGIAKFTDAATGNSSATRTGSVLGTPYYMSPEQARGLRSVDHRSDLWSIGVIAYRCIVGQLPFEGEAVGDLLVKLCTAPIPVPSHFAPDVPPGFDAWLMKSLSREPELRFQSAAEQAASLAALCGLSSRGGYATGEIRMTPPPSLQSGGYRPVYSATTPMHSQAGVVTGAPITQTPTPTASPSKPNVGLFVALGFAAVVALGVGGLAVATVFAGGGPASAEPAAPLPPVTTTAEATPVKVEEPRAPASVTPLVETPPAPESPPAASASATSEKPEPATARPARVVRPTQTTPPALTRQVQPKPLPPKPAQTTTSKPASKEIDIGY
jgi:serine/threonine protein kinase